MFQKIMSFFKSKREPKNIVKFKNIFVAMLVIIIALIFISSFEFGAKPQKTTKVDTKNISAMEYCEVVENRLTSVLENVKGIGSVSVFIMVDSSPTIKYLEETDIQKKQSGDLSDKQTESIKTTIVMSKNGTITTPVVVVELLPKITGVLIVASGAKDVKFKTMLINITSSVLSVDISKVEVMEGK